MQSRAWTRSFGVCVAICCNTHMILPSWQLTYPLKIDDWEIKFPFKMVPVHRTFVHFRGVTGNVKCFMWWSTVLYMCCLLDFNGSSLLNQSDHIQCHGSRSFLIKYIFKVEPVICWLLSPFRFLYSRCIKLLNLGGKYLNICDKFIKNSPGFP